MLHLKLTACNMKPWPPLKRYNSKLQEENFLNLVMGKHEM